MSTVTYIEHSGFLLETDDIAMLFDYYKGDIPKTDKPLYIFASHRHHDHFAPAIMTMPCKKLILSSDIRVVPTPDTVKLGPNKTFITDDLEIKTLKSTDEGVAFIVRYKNKIIYHAGDLNDWYWEGEDPQWNNKMTESYRRIIREGFCDIPRVDIAFLPVDSRLGEAYDSGAAFFMQNVKAGMIFPMHFWGDYKCVANFAAKYKNENICKITSAQQIFNTEV